MKASGQKPTEFRSWQRRPSLTNRYMLLYSMYTKIPLTSCMQYKNNPILHSFSVWKQACLETCHYIIFPPWSRHTDRYRFKHWSVPLYYIYNACGAKWKNNAMKKDLADLETWAKVTATLHMNTIRLEAAWVNQEEKYI